MRCPICKEERSACVCPTVAAKDATCPSCGIEVGGHVIGRTLAGATTFDRPSRHDAGPTGTRFYSGGLTHVENGERCVPAKGLVP